MAKAKSKRIKAVIYIDGMVTYSIYSTKAKLGYLLERATKDLTHWEPGGGSLYPNRFEIMEKVREIDGRTNEWKLVSKTLYKDIPEDQQEWRKRTTAQAKAKQKAKAESDASAKNHTMNGRWCPECGGACAFRSKDYKEPKTNIIGPFRAESMGNVGKFGIYRGEALIAEVYGEKNAELFAASPQLLARAAEALETISSVAEQQAMPDDSWKARIAPLGKLVDKLKSYGIEAAKPDPEWNKTFKQGYVCAVAALVQSHGADVEARELMACIGKVTQADIDDHDYQILKKAELL